MQSLTGTIALNSHGGLPLLQTAFGLLALETSSVFPAGTIVTVEQLGEPTPPAVTSGPSPLTTGQTGAGIEETIDILRQIAPQTILPTPTDMSDFSSHLVAALIGLTAAVDSGNARAWLGDRLIKTLSKDGHRALIERLEKDLSALKTPVRMPFAGEWLCLILPLPLGQRIERIRLIVRRNKEDGEDGKRQDEEGARFLLDVDMSRLGAIQIDGLLQRKAKRFDVILRTRTTLPDDIRRDIKALFVKSLDGMGMVGSASFQQTPNFIEPVPTITSDISGWVI